MTDFASLGNITKIKSMLNSEDVSARLAEKNIDARVLHDYVDRRHEASANVYDGYWPSIQKPVNDEGPRSTVRGITEHSSEDFSGRGPTPVAPIKPMPLKGRKLNVDAFSQAIHAQLSTMPISGYTLKIRNPTSDVYTLYWNWARRPQDQQELGWKPDVKMHVASVSKLVTAMAVVKLLHERGISPDTRVVNFLPTYFKHGLNMTAITFRHLLTHTSGFRQVKDWGGLNDGYDFEQFKSYVEKGVNFSDIGSWHYHNGNFIGLRIAMCVLTGGSRDNGIFYQMTHLPWFVHNFCPA